MGYLVYLALDLQIFAEPWQVVIEIGSEVLMHFTSILLSQYAVLNYNDEALSAIELFSLILLGVMLTVNISFAIRIAVQGCKRKCRKRLLSKKKKLIAKTQS